MCKLGTTASARKDIEHGHDTAGELDAQPSCSATVLKHVPEPLRTSDYGTGHNWYHHCQPAESSCHRNEGLLQLQLLRMRPLEGNRLAHRHRAGHRARLMRGKRVGRGSGAVTGNCKLLGVLRE